MWLHSALQEAFPVKVVESIDSDYQKQTVTYLIPLI